MTPYEAARAIAELLKSYPALDTLPAGALVRTKYSELLKKLFDIALGT